MGVPEYIFVRLLSKFLDDQLGLTFIWSFFMSPHCDSLFRPVTGFTNVTETHLYRICLQSSSLLYWVDI